MSWYWWLLLAAAALFVLTRIRGRAQWEKRKERQSDSLDDLPALQRYRKQQADADREVAKVVGVVEALPVLEGAQAAGNALSRAQLSDSIRKFLGSKAMLEWNTGTKMVHVVVAPAKVTVFAKLKPTEPGAAVRIFTRVGEDTWAVETRQAGDMERAIQVADREAAAS